MSSGTDEADGGIGQTEIILGIMETVADGMILSDSAGRILLANTPAERMFGFVAGGLAGKPLELLLPEHLRTANLSRWLGHAQKPKGRATGEKLELLGLTRDGREIPIEIGRRLLKIGQNTFVSSIVRDLTEQQKSQEALIETQHPWGILAERRHAAEVLRQANETLETIINASPLAIITFDPAGIITTWSKEAERLLGFSAAEVIGRAAPRTMIPPAVLHTSSLADRVQDGETLRNFETRRRRKDGTIIDVSVSTGRFLDAHGEVDGFVFIVDDITQRRVLGEQLNHAQKMEAIGQLTGGLAHDFNNLLSVVICNLELLQEDLPPASEMFELAGTALEAALRGAELTRQMLTFSRKQSLEPRALEVNELVLDTVKLLARTLGQQIEIVLETQPGLWPIVADPAQLQAALANLATNARDAMPDGGKLVFQTLTATLDTRDVGAFPDLEAGDYVVLSVTDTGCGMMPEVVRRAFEPFFTTKPIGEGTGLGLSMVFGFVKQSGGHVEIYSEPGYGTTVKLYLPRACQAEPVPPVQTPAPRPAPANDETILVVEDNIPLAESVQALLNDAGFAVILAGSAKAALEILERGRAVDLLFTDLVMPGGMNGLELARLATARNPALKVLFTSGFSDAALDPDRRLMLRDRFISKPYRRNELLLKLRQVLDTSESGEQPP